MGFGFGLGFGLGFRLGLGLGLQSGPGLGLGLGWLDFGWLRFIPSPNHSSHPHPNPRRTIDKAITPENRILVGLARPKVRARASVRVRVRVNS